MGKLILIIGVPLILILLAAGFGLFLIGRDLIGWLTGRKNEESNGDRSSNPEL